MLHSLGKSGATNNWIRKSSKLADLLRSWLSRDPICNHGSQFPLVALLRVLRGLYGGCGCRDYKKPNFTYIWFSPLVGKFGLWAVLLKCSCYATGAASILSKAAEVRQLRIQNKRQMYYLAAFYTQIATWVGWLLSHLVNALFLPQWLRSTMEFLGQEYMQIFSASVTLKHTHICDTEAVLQTQWICL